MLKIAIYISSHGFGHASRMAALADELIKYQVSVFLRCDRPDFLFDNLGSAFYSKDSVSCDFGVKHTKGLQTDMAATKDALLSLFSTRNEIIEREVSWLREQEIDFALVDIPFLAIEACDYASVPVFAISNFDWFFIYSQIFAADKELRPMINTIFGLYSRVHTSFRLPFSSKQSMPAFSNATKVGILAKRKDAYEDIRKKYLIDEQEPILACSFGGEKGMQVDLDKICKAFKGVVISSNEELENSNHRHADQADDWLDIIHGCDVLLTKPGYSTFAEACQFGKPILYLPRQNYPEEKVLIKGLTHYKAAVEVASKTSSIAAWKSIFAVIKDKLIAPGSFRNQNASIATSIIGAFFAYSQRHRKLKSVFDIGSNNLNYLVFDSDDSWVLHTAHYNTGLSKGLAAKDCRQIKSVMRNLMKFDMQIDSQKLAISTAVAREHSNFKALSAWLLHRYNLKVKVLKQQQEAAAAFSAVKASLPFVPKPLVVDIGGMSTELAWGSSFKTRTSIDIGLLSLEDTSYILLYHDMLKELPDIPDIHNYSLVITGLTGTYIASAIYKYPYQLAWKGHAKSVRLCQIDALLLSLDRDDESKAEITAQGMNSFILKAALRFVKLILQRYQMTECLICYYGISLGYLLN